MRYATKTFCSLGLALSFLLSSPLLSAWETPTTEEATSNDTESAAPEETVEAPAPVKAPVPGKVHRYVERIFEKYDKDLDGVLAPDEWLGMRGYPILIAGSAEETITKERLIDYVAAYGHRRRIRLLFSPMKMESFGPTLLHPSEDGPNGNSAMTDGSANNLSKEALGGGKQFYVPASHMPNGLPGWFFARDANGDGQLSLSEFAIDGTQSSMSEFDKLDTDGDGVLSPRDLVKTAPKKPTPPKTIPPITTPKKLATPKPVAEPPTPEKPNAAPAVENNSEEPKPNRKSANGKRGQRRKRNQKE